MAKQKRNNSSETHPAPGSIDTPKTIRVGKDEMNIIEHPFASLWKNESREAIIYHEWETQHPVTNQLVKAWWRVEGSPELGLPTTADERVYLVLMELTREANFE